MQQGALTYSVVEFSVLLSIFHERHLSIYVVIDLAEASGVTHGLPEIVGVHLPRATQTELLQVLPFSFQDS